MEETLKEAMRLADKGDYDEAAKLLSALYAKMAEATDFDRMVNHLESYRAYIKEALTACRDKKIGASQQIGLADDSLERAKKLMIKFLEKFK